MNQATQQKYQDEITKQLKTYADTAKKYRIPLLSIDYKIYSTFLTKKIFKDRDLIVYKADKNNSLEYQFDYSVLEQDEKIKVSNFFYKIKDFLNKSNFNSEVNQIYSINSNKRRIPLYIQQFPVINQKNYFNFIFQQNLKNII